MNKNIHLSFEDGLAQPDKDHKNLYLPRQEIIHQFREEEKRPPNVVAFVFAGLTILPLLILLILVRKRVDFIIP